MWNEVREDISSGVRCGLVCRYEQRECRVVDEVMPEGGKWSMYRACLSCCCAPCNCVRDVSTCSKNGVSVVCVVVQPVCAACAMFDTSGEGGEQCCASCAVLLACVVVITPGECLFLVWTRLVCGARGVGALCCSVCVAQFMGSGQPVPLPCLCAIRCNLGAYVLS